MRSIQGFGHGQQCAALVKSKKEQFDKKNYRACAVYISFGLVHF